MNLMYRAVVYGKDTEYLDLLCSHFVYVYQNQQFVQFISFMFEISKLCGLISFDFGYFWREKYLGYQNGYKVLSPPTKFHQNWSKGKCPQTSRHQNFF